MIVLPHQKGWKVITQRAHGLLAAMLAYPFDIDLPNELIVPLLIAVAEHDDGVSETKQSKNLTENGAPRHFQVGDPNSKTPLEQYVNVMELSTSKSQLNALLTSMHLAFIFKDKKDGVDKDLDLFLNDQVTNRKNLLKSLGLTLAESNRLYRYLEWCDAFSLLITMEKLQPEGRKMEISKSPDGQMNEAYYKNANEISVTPWPFKVKSFKVFYEYRIVGQLQFKSIEEFNQAYQEAAVQRHDFLISK